MPNKALIPEPVYAPQVHAEALYTGDGAGTLVEAKADDLNVLVALPGGTVGFAVAGGAQNVAEVTCTLREADGTALTHPVVCDVWLSDAADGSGLAAQPDAIAVKAASGTQLGVLTSNKALTVISKADGTFIIQVTDAAQTAMNICVLPRGCHMASIGAIAAADYTD